MLNIVIYKKGLLKEIDYLNENVEEPPTIYNPSFLYSLSLFINSGSKSNSIIYFKYFKLFIF